MTTDVSHAPRNGPVPQPPPAATGGGGGGRHHRKPFSSLMKRLAGLKTSHHQHPAPSKSNGLFSGDTNNTLSKTNSGPIGHTSKSGRGTRGKHRSNSHPNLPTPVNTTSTVNTILGPSYEDFKHHSSSGHHSSPSAVSDASTNTTNSPSSTAPKPSNQTITTTATSLKSPSTFSSPAPSVRSLTTTLTTIQSTAPNLGQNGTGYHNYNPHPSHHHNPNAPPVLFNNPLPSPTHLHLPNSNSYYPSTPSAPGSGPQHIYYSTATANGLLTDNASIITLASSSKRRRRHSFDTDASIRALAPASLWGGSRESLPLSVLSSFDNASMDRDRPTNGSIRNPGERSSLYGRLGGGDASSVRGINHGVLGNAAEAQPTTPRENHPLVLGCVGGRSRRSSGWGEVHLDEGDRIGDVDGDDLGSVRSRRTASIVSEKTGDEGEVGEGKVEGEQKDGHEETVGVDVVGNMEVTPAAPIVLNRNTSSSELGEGKSRE